MDILTFYKMSSDDHTKRLLEKWDSSSHQKPKTLLINNNDNLFIVISSTNKIYRCVNKKQQIVVFPYSSLPTLSHSQENIELYLIECKYATDIDIFVLEKLFPVIFK